MGAFTDKEGNISKDVYQNLSDQLKKVRGIISEEDAARAAAGGQEHTAGIILTVGWPQQPSKADGVGDRVGVPRGNRHLERRVVGREYA